MDAAFRAACGGCLPLMPDWRTVGTSAADGPVFERWPSAAGPTPADPALGLLAAVEPQPRADARGSTNGQGNTGAPPLALQAAITRAACEGAVATPPRGPLEIAHRAAAAFGGQRRMPAPHGEALSAVWGGLVQITNSGAIHTQEPAARAAPEGGGAPATACPIAPDTALYAVVSALVEQFTLLWLPSAPPRPGWARRALLQRWLNGEAAGNGHGEAWRNTAEAAGGGEPYPAWAEAAARLWRQLCPQVDTAAPSIDRAPSRTHGTTPPIRDASSTRRAAPSADMDAVVEAVAALWEEVVAACAPAASQGPMSEATPPPGSAWSRPGDLVGTAVRAGARAALPWDTGQVVTILVPPAENADALARRISAKAGGAVYRARLAGPLRVWLETSTVPTSSSPENSAGC